jgi:hypothetical protein
MVLEELIESNTNEVVMSRNQIGAINGVCMWTLLE